jgi:hypothetical protein
MRSRTRSGYSDAGSSGGVVPRAQSAMKYVIQTDGTNEPLDVVGDEKRRSQVMGEYFHIVCHTCRVQHTPKLLKLREIFINENVAAEVGRFATHHPGHLLELRGDEYNYLHEYPDDARPTA